MLTSARMVTLTGAAGSGKTRLAVEAASEVAADYPDGLWFVDLAVVNDPGLAVKAVASVFGLRDHPSRSLLEVLVDRLQESCLLLVLDNCEHLVEACAGIATALLGTKETRILATSRESLNVAGEVVWRIPTMAVPPRADSYEMVATSGYEAVRLFLDRAKRATDDFELTAPNLSAVAQICQQLDGLPLAIELAAACARVMSPNQILTRLKEQFRVLADYSRSGLERHQTLERALDWSYGLLSEHERVLLARLSIFGAGFTLESAEAVCSDEALPTEEVLEALTRLIDKSMVVPGDPTRNQVRHRLLEPIRQYARRRLDESGEADRVQGRLCELCLSIARDASGRLTSRDGQIWLDLVDEEHDNMRLALQWADSTAPEMALKLASALTAYWDMRGHLAEGREWLDRSLAKYTEPTRHRAEALTAAGLLAWRQGDQAAASTRYTEGLTLSRDLSDQELIGRALSGLGDALYLAGDYERAKALFEESLAMSREQRDKPATARNLSRVASAVAVMGDPPASLPLLEESLALTRDLDDTHGIANLLWSIGIAFEMTEDYARSIPYFEESLELRRTIKDAVGVAFALLALAWAQLQSGNIRAAHATVIEAIKMLRSMGDQWGVSLCLDHLSCVAVAEGNSERAFRLAGAATTVREKSGAQALPWVQALVDRWLERARIKLGAAAVERAFSEGKALSFNAAVDYALAEAFGIDEAVIPSGKLSHREMEIAALVGQGLTNREIGASLFISERTVDNHVQHVLEKLGFRRRAQIGRWLGSEHHPGSAGA